MDVKIWKCKRAAAATTVKGPSHHGWKEMHAALFRFVFFKASETRILFSFYATIMFYTVIFCHINLNKTHLSLWLQSEKYENY